MAPRLNLITAIVLVAVSVLVSAQQDQASFPGVSQADFPGLIRGEGEQEANVTTSQEASSNDTSVLEQQPADQPELPVEPPTRPPKPAYASTFPPLVHQEGNAATGEPTQKPPADTTMVSKPSTQSTPHDEPAKKQGGGDAGAEFCGANLALVLAGAFVVRFLY